MRLLLSFLFVALLLPACGPDQPDNIAPAATLDGRWELVAARRDNVETNLLDNLYFDFGEEGVFRTNLLTNEEQTGTYELDGTEITTEGTEVPLTYEIQELDADRLVLRTRYQGFIFDFELAPPPAGSAD